MRQIISRILSDATKRVFRFAILIFLIVLPQLSSAQNSTTSSSATDSLGAESSPRLQNAYGIRGGIGFRDGSAVALPVFNPYFEVPIGGIIISAELQLAFQNFSTLNIFHDPSLWLDAYGWSTKIRWFYDNSSGDRFFSSAGYGMTVHPDRVSAELPISTGYLWKLSPETELEGLLNFTPLFYIGVKLGWFVSATIGFRFPNFQ